MKPNVLVDAIHLVVDIYIQYKCVLGKPEPSNIA